MQSTARPARPYVGSTPATYNHLYQTPCLDDEDALADAATIEEFTCVGSTGSSLRVISRSMIDQYRRASRQSKDTRLRKLRTILPCRLRRTRVST